MYIGTNTYSCEYKKNRFIEMYKELPIKRNYLLRNYYSLRYELARHHSYIIDIYIPILYSFCSICR